MRRLLVLVVALASVPAANAAPPACVATGATSGEAPLHVAFAATCEGTVFRWRFGDGRTAAGARVAHRFRPGRYTATLTMRTPRGTRVVRRIHVRAFTLSLSGPRVTNFGGTATFSGRLVPAPRAGEPATVRLTRGRHSVTVSRLGPGGRFRFRVKAHAPGAFRARFRAVSSPPAALLVRPVLQTSLAGIGVSGEPLRLVARVRPRTAGTIRVQVWRSGRSAMHRSFGPAASLRLATNGAESFRLRISTLPRAGYAGVTRTLRAAVRTPSISLGSSGSDVEALERRLSDLSYSLRGVDGSYGSDTYEAVLAFQKVHGLERTGRVDAVLWRALAAASRPRARYGGDHVEVDKARQILLLVRNGSVTSTIHVSTGATGNTPLGRWQVYRKVAGWDWVLYHPSYFLRGFAVHGYPSVPAYPASHGCVRVPMWLATTISAAMPYGSSVYVY